MKQIEVNYSIEDNVPVPVPVRVEHWPVEALEVGQSFVFPKAQRKNIQSKASHIKRETGKDFTVRLINKTECRIWRLK